MPKPSSKNQKSNDSNLNFEAQLWAAADKMRGHMDASEYKHVCLGLIFLKYISDAFEEKREQLVFGFSDPKSEWFIKDEPERKEAAENRDEYLAANVFWLPREARWHTIKAKAKSPEIEARARQSTAEFHALKVSQRPAFELESSIGDRAVFSGLARSAPLVAVLDAMLDDAAAYDSFAGHFGGPPSG